MAGDETVDVVSGASPVAVRAGRNVSLWIWGKVFDNGSNITFTRNGASLANVISPYARQEVLVESRSHQGFSGIRNFLNIAPGALPGDVDVTVSNPNGSTATLPAAFSIIDAAAVGDPGQAGGGGPIAYDGPCPDEVAVVELVTEVQPRELPRGSIVNLAIKGRGFGCGASVIIPGGGLAALAAPQIARTNPLDPAETALFWQLQVAENAPLGPRDVTVVNPNNSNKLLPQAFAIVEANGDDGEDGGGDDGGCAFCSAAPGRNAPPGLAFLLALGGLGLARVLRSRRI